ncbi:MAG: MFS transporter [Chitinophagaceae bacterium]|nr:MAG: MFS transporter [Chitinophagaceae bacterium]
MPSRLSANGSLFLLVFSQFAGTSVWFAGNAITDQIATADAGATITSFVQFGFIAGTLVFSLLTVADRFQASTVFFYSSLLAAAANLLLAVYYKDASTIKLLRFATGFFLAGIYPVGMKIAADVAPQKLGRALGWLVGALVLGTSFPHLVRSRLEGIQWEIVVITTSLLAALGGVLVFLFIPRRKKQGNTTKPEFLGAFALFKSPSFRSAAFGYFGHMWELYAFWAILPLLFTHLNALWQISSNVYWWSFLVIAAGSAGCIAGGYLSQRWGSKKVAATALLLSGACCAVFPLVANLNLTFAFGLLLFWGFAVTADSPQFSALVAKAAPEKNRGTALTIVTSIGFAITIASILLLKDVFLHHKEKALWLLLPGPVLGLFAMRKNDLV